MDVHFATAPRAGELADEREREAGIEREAGPTLAATPLPKGDLMPRHKPPVPLGEAPAPVSRTLADLFGHSIAKSTARAYEAILERLDERLGGSTLTDHGLAEYLSELYDQGQAPNSIAQVVSAVRFRAKLQGVASPVGPVTSRALAGIRRAGKDRRQGQVQGVGFAAATAAAAVAGSDDLRKLAGLRDAALIAVASDGLLRVSEIAAIQVEDVEQAEDGSGRLTIRSSKTDQEGAGEILYLGEPTIVRVAAWTEAAGTTSGPVFVRVRKNGLIGTRALSSVSIRRIIRDRCKAVGVEGRVSGHSLRVGGAQSLAAGGASLVEMQQAGRWQSPSMPGHYAKAQLAARGAVARIRYGLHQPGDGSPALTGATGGPRSDK